MKIDLNVPVLDLAGVPIKESGNSPEIVTCSRLLSNNLIQGSKGDAIKFYDWAQALYKNQPIEVDNSDFKKIRSFIDESEGVSILAKAQILKALDACEKRHTEDSVI